MYCTYTESYFSLAAAKKGQLSDRNSRFSFSFRDPLISLLYQDGIVLYHFFIRAEYPRQHAYDAKTKNLHLTPFANFRLVPRCCQKQRKLYAYCCLKT